MPMTHPPTVLFKTLTPQMLEPFNGKDGGRILLAINGIVFDVTAGRNYYGPSAYPFPNVKLKDYALARCERIDGMYGNFAGRDASRGMAKQSFDLGPFLTSTPNVAYPVAHDIRSEMLTLIHQPLDKLEDLQSDEVYVVHPHYPETQSNECSPDTTVRI
jgi:membrane-associated progesterone receptor component